MAIPSCVSNTCNLSNILPILFDDPTFNGVISPSKYVKEMKMTTKGRLEFLSRSSRKNRLSTKLNTFSRNPDIVVFQNFEPDVKYTATLTLTNINELSRNLFVIFKPSPIFSYSFSGNKCTKVAPGMNVNIHIHFCAFEVRDYKHEISFRTEGEVFTVDLIAISLRPIVNFPDSLTLPQTSVKIPSEKYLVLRNISRVDAGFVLKTSTPFQVKPERVMLLPEKSMGITIKCNSPKTGCLKGRLEVYYEDGIVICIPLECDITVSPINLENDTVRFTDTFMGLKSSGTLILRNHSEHTCNFSWMKSKSLAIDSMKRDTMRHNSKVIEVYEKPRYVKLEKMNIIDGEGHCKINERIHKDYDKDFVNDQWFVYENSSFTIIPMSGSLAPNSSKTFDVVFTPVKNYVYDSWAYLEVCGREDRLPVHFSGIGLGPELVLNVKILDINEIFICTHHQYEIVVFNKGFIEGTLIYIEKELEFGGKLKVCPNTIQIKPDNCLPFIIKYTTRFEGLFSEVLSFLIEESNEIIHMTIKGNAYCPVLTCPINEINLDKVPYGFLYSRDISLKNSSPVPIEFKIEIYLMQNKKMVLLENQEHTTIIPRFGEVKANSTLIAELSIYTILSNSQEFRIVISMWDNKKFTHVFLKYYSTFPHIESYPNQINADCFLDFTYEGSVSIINKTDFPGKLIWYRYDFDETENPIKYTLSSYEYAIEAKETIEMKIYYRLTRLGTFTCPILFQVFGGQPVEVCKLICSGQGPILTYDPEILNFGRIKLLNNYSLDLNITNDSPIYTVATFKTPKTTVFELDETYLEMNPNTTRVLRVSVYLKDPGKYSTTIKIIQDNADTDYVKVSATGYGTSILCEPMVEPEVNAGYLLTYINFSMTVKFTNLGKDYHKLIWTRNQDLKGLREEPKDKKQSVFSFNPSYFELDSDESITCNISGICKKPLKIEEDFYCFGMVGKSQKEELLGFLMKGEFLHPQIELSRDEMNFFVRIDNENVSQLLTDVIVIKNPLKFPLNVKISTQAPFYYVDEDELIESKNKTLEPNKKFNCYIHFDPALDTKKAHTIKGELVIQFIKHPMKTVVPLTGQVYYPSIDIYDSKVNFDCVVNLATSYRIILLKNTSCIPVTFNWTILQEKFNLSHLTPVPIIIPDDKPETDIWTSEEEESEELEGTFIVIEDNTEPEIENTKPSIEILYEKSENFNREPSKQCLLQSSNNSIEEKEGKFIYEPKKLQELLFSVLDPVNHENDNLINVLKKENTININEILTIEPFHGTLEPHESCTVYISVNLPADSLLNAKAHCQIIGGETEELEINAKSSSISYKLDNYIADFKRQVFCEKCKINLQISNTGFMNFDYSTKYLHDYESNLGMPDCLEVNPKTGILNTGETQTLEIEYYPGFVGEIQQEIDLEIGYLDPINIQVRGFAEISQIYMSLPFKFKTSPYEEFMAISHITDDYLKELEPFPKLKPSAYFKELQFEISKLEKKYLKKNDWVIVENKVLYPSTMDIQMAIERRSAYLYMSDSPETIEDHAIKRRCAHIPGLFTSPYIYNFGYVLLNSNNTYKIPILNYGPTKCTFKLKYENKAFAEKCFKIETKNRAINIGESFDIIVKFDPVVEVFKDYDTSVSVELNLIISHGATVPLILKGVVTFPLVRLDNKCVDFNGVRCGDCLRKTLKITNSGHILSKWKAELIPTSKKQRSSFCINKYSGKLDVGKECLIEVYFKPTHVGSQIVNLVITCENGYQTTSAELRGFAFKSKLAFNDKNIKFDPVLPNSIKKSNTLIVQNVSTLPVEFYFTSYDTKILHEEYMLDLYCKYHNVDEVFIPYRHPGEGLPEEFTYLYKDLQKDYKDFINGIEKHESELEEEQNLISNTKLSTQELFPAQELYGSNAKLTAQESFVATVKFSTQDLHTVKSNVQTNESFAPGEKIVVQESHISVKFSTREFFGTDAQETLAAGESTISFNGITSSGLRDYEISRGRWGKQFIYCR